MRGRRQNNGGETNSNHERNYDNDSDSDSDSDSDDESSVTNECNVFVSESEILYSIESFNAVVTPVTITMVVSALVVAFINTEETIAAGEEIFAWYHVLDVEGDDSSDQSAAQKLGHSLVNTLVIVSVLCAMTFVVVLCYKYKCMKIFYAYLVLVVAALLGYYTTLILLVAISIYPWISVDKLTLAFLMYNYAAVGTIAIFLPRGFPRWIPQGYLIAGSVCLAWELSFFNAWMTWTLLVMLALYDLFAVLTPCGPLKFLAELISQEGAPGLPGMLYEARLPSGVSRRNTLAAGPDGAANHRRSNRTRSSRRHTNEEQDESNNRADDRRMGSHSENGNGNIDNSDDINNASSDPGDLTSTRLSQTTTAMTNSHSATATAWRQNSTSQIQSQNDQQGNGLSNNTTGTTMPLSQPDMSNKGKAPLVLARMYQLAIFDKKGVLQPREQNENGRSVEDHEDVSAVSTRRHPTYYTAEEILEIEWTPQQLNTRVTCIFPPRGGRIAKAKSREQKYDAGIAYIVYDRLGNQQRKFVVTPTGTVKEVLRREASGDENDGGDNGGDDVEKSTIKLGIGDFIFYSLLVSQAAQYSFTAFASCLLVVMFGLAATLVILAIKGQALPALPISIFLGVITFLWTRTFLQPWIDDFLVQSIYV